MTTIYPAWVAVNIVDALSTWIGMGSGLMEINPALASLTGVVGPTAALGMKVAVAALVGLGVLYWRPRVLRFLVAALVLVVAWNLLALQIAL